MDQDSMDAAKGVEILRALTSGTKVGGDSNINVNLQGTRVTTMMLVISTSCCVVMLIVALVVGLFGGLWVLDDRAEVRAQLRERRDGENAIRAYINTGILKPMTEKEKQDAE